MRRPSRKRSFKRTGTMPLTTSAMLGTLAALGLIGCSAGGGGGGRASTPPPASGGGPGNGNSPAPGAPTEVRESLDRLGVDTTETSRVDENQDPLPPDYSPLGSACTLAQNDELFLVGMQLIDPAPAGTPQPLPNRAAFIELADDNTGDVGLSITNLFEPGQAWEPDMVSPHPSFGERTAGGQGVRAAAAADVDGDGLDEIVIARIAPAAPGQFAEILITILDESGAAGMNVDFSQPERVVTAIQDVRDVAVIAGDFDGDGDDDVALGLATMAGAQVMPLSLGENGVFTIEETAVQMLPQRIAGSQISLETAAGNIDLDNGVELVVVVNEYEPDTNIGRSRYWVFDDALAGYAALASEQAIRVEQPQTFEAITADVALGDLDGDARDEIVFGGLTEFEQDSCAPTTHVYLALEDAHDAANPLGSIGGDVFSFNYIATGVGCNQNSHFLRVQHAFVNTLDLDGDNLAEVQVNLRVFDDWTNPGGPWTEIYTLPREEFLDEPSGQRQGGTLSRATAQMVTGDVTGDGRDDVITFVQWREAITVWGLNGPSPEAAQWEQVVGVPTEFYNGQARVFPIVVPCNVDTDGLALKYSEAEYRLVFTEPIIMAALAAAPCVAGINQNFDACRTAYGTAESQNVGVDGTVSVRASSFVGGDVEVFGFGAEARATVTATASFSAGRAYELEQTIEYVTGPMEDTVIIATLPVDQYTYTVVSHPDPAMVGMEVVVNLPRTPITLQVEREFYNASAPPGAFQIGSNVFLHTPGDIDSYPTEGDADALIETGGLGHLGPLGELVDAAGEALGPIGERLLGDGLRSSRAVSVGASGGESSVEIRFSESADYRAGAEIDFEVEASTTVLGVTVGGSIGGSVEAALSWGSSNATIYRGTVGDIAPADFSANSYSYGLFTYIFNYGDPTKPQFEVINYWVER